MYMTKFEDRIVAYRLEEQMWMNSIPNGRVYEELRFAKVYNLHPNIYSIYIPCTHNMGDNWVHLVVGEEKIYWLILVMLLVIYDHLSGKTEGNNPSV